MLAKCEAVPKGLLWDMFVFRNPFPPFLLGIPSIRSLQEAWVPETAVRSASSGLCYGCIMPIASLQLQKTVEKACLMQRSRGSGHMVMASKICHNVMIVLSVVLCDCQWTVVEIECLAIVGSNWGCQPFSCRCSQNVTHCRNEVCSTYLFKASIPAIPFGNSQHPISTRSLSSRERQYVPPALHCIMVASCPSLRCSCRKR